ncbi:uncharacterized protein LOC144440151 isoform X2 [Glandiceps talaboti]
MQYYEYLKITPVRQGQKLNRDKTVLYFESNERSNGGRIQTVKYEDDWMLIQFQSHEVLKAVLSLNHLDYNVERVTHTRSNDNPVDRKCILLRGLPPTMSKEDVIGHLKSSTGITETPRLRFGKDAVLVKYLTEITDFDHIKTSLMRGTTAIVQQVQFTNTIKVKNVPDSVDEDLELLKLFYERPIISGGDDIEDKVVRQDTNTATIWFKDYQVVQKVLVTKHKIEGTVVDVEPYYEELENLMTPSRDKTAESELSLTHTKLAVLQKECDGLKAANTIFRDKYHKELKEKELLVKELVNANQVIEEVVGDKVAKEIEIQRCKEKMAEQERQLVEINGITMGHENDGSLTTKDVCPERDCGLVPTFHVELKDKIANGNSSDVWTAKYLDDIIVVKQLRPQEGTRQALGYNGFLSQNVCERYNMMKTLQGQFTVKGLGACSDSEKGSYWLLMGYLPNGSLCNFLRNCEMTLNWEDKTRMALDACQCIKCLHCREFPMVLGKLSSRKFLVDADRRIKVYDFSKTDTLANCNRHVTLDRYMPPEHFLNINKQGSEEYTLYTERYGLGIILWEIATRKVPFEGKCDSQIFNHIMETGNEVLPEDCPASYKEVTDGLRKFDQDSRIPVEDAVSKLTALIESSYNE